MSLCKVLKVFFGTKMEKFDRNIYTDLIDRHASLFLDESRKDVTFVFKDSDEKITAHKFVLETASPVFKSMFSGSFFENDEVKIDDISPEIFKLFLSGIYLNDIHSQITSDRPASLYADLYYAAEKYDIKDIRELSKNFMIEHCHSGNTNTLLTKAKLFNLPDLEARCKDFFQKNTYYVLANHIDLNVKNGYFHEFFDLENLSVNTEFDLYMALQATVDNKQLLDYSKYLSKIRFLTMEIPDILICKLLSSDDKVAIISNIEAKKLKKPLGIPMPAHLSIDNKPRKFSNVNKYPRQYFWTALMLKCAKYEDYFEIFFNQMEISPDSEERTKALINNGRKEADANGRVPYETITKTTKNIYAYE